MSIDILSVEGGGQGEIAATTPNSALSPFNLFSSQRVHIYRKLLRATASATESMSKYTPTVVIKDAAQTCWEGKLIPPGARAARLAHNKTSKQKETWRDFQR